MPLAIYLKENTAQKRFQAKKRDRTFFTIITALGLVSIIFSIWPYFSWQLTVAKRFTSQIENAPIPAGLVLSANTHFAEGIQVAQDPDGFSYFVPTKQFDKLTSQDTTRPKEFFLTIPKLEIEKAKAKVDNLNFYTNLSHFPQTALPGEIGNSFITGHSVLPQFNDPENYRAIFTKLSDLEIGDDVYVEMGDSTFHYVVQYAKIVDPHDLSVLAPMSPTGRNLTLMTCVPPGTSTKRLVVITSLI